MPHESLLFTSLVSSAEALLHARPVPSRYPNLVSISVAYRADYLQSLVLAFGGVMGDTEGARAPGFHLDSPMK